MLKNYKLTFTQDKSTYITRVVPAKNLAEAYLIIQDNYPGAEITDYAESNNATERWAQIIAKHMINNACLSEVCSFACTLDEGKHDEFINAIWDEWHKKTRRSKAV